MKYRIENEFEQSLTWERMNDMVTCRIKHKIGGVSYFDEDTWPKLNEFLHDYSFKMVRAFREPVKKLSIF